MKHRRVIGPARWIAVVLILCMCVATQAQEPSPATAATAPPASIAPTPSAINPTARPSVAPSPTAQMLYPSSSPSTLMNASAGQSTGAASLATTFLVLLALCAGGFVLWRRGPNGFAAGFKGTVKKLVVSESRSLGNRQFLVVVEYESERMLLGVTPGKIDYLCPLTGPHGEPGAFPPIKEVGA